MLLLSLPGKLFFNMTIRMVDTSSFQLFMGSHLLKLRGAPVVKVQTMRLMHSTSPSILLAIDKPIANFSWKPYYSIVHDPQWRNARISDVPKIDES
jgi:hypothetical protein